MKLFQIVPDISYEANGVTPVINGLGHYAVEHGHEVTVCALGAKLDDPRIRFLQARRPRLFGANEYSPDFARHLRTAFRESDVVHGHSLWSAANLTTGLQARKRSASLVVSPHGTLTEHALTRRRTLKKLLWPLQNLALARADLLHATAPSEIDDLRRVGYRGPIALIANAVDMPEPLPAHAERRKQLLFLSRIHPKKGLENLLHAWATLAGTFPDWELVIAGVGAPEYEKSLHELAASLGLVRVTWHGPAYGADKAALYRSAGIFVLPTHSENFGMVVAEAMSHGMPCLVSTGAPWAALPAIDAGWWVDNAVESLRDHLARAMALPTSRLREMGERGRAYVQREFSWDRVGAGFLQAYGWLQGSEPRPDFIHD